MFYTTDLSVLDLTAAGLVLGALILLNRRGVLRLWPYLLLGIALWVLVYRSGIHATLAGVALALTIPLRSKGGATDNLGASPLHRLEHHLHLVVPFVIVPVFGFANAGVSFSGMELDTLVQPLTLGVSGGLVIGKLVGVLGSVALAVRLGIADLPAQASWRHMVGVALICGIGFTMSLFIGLLAFADNPVLQDEVKLGILAGSVIAALSGTVVLLTGRREGKA